jgi:hypothetical protein
MKQTFVLKNNWIGIFNRLSDKQAGMLIKMLFEHNVNGGELAGMNDEVVNAYFNMMILDCKIFNENYDKRSITSSNNGSLGGAPKGNQNAKKQPKNNLNNLNNLNNPNDNDNDNDNDCDSEEDSLKPTVGLGEESPKKKPPPEKPLAERVTDFKDEIRANKQSGEITYTNRMLSEFFDYWSETNKNGLKMRWELEKTWDLNLRLKNWYRRQRE